MGIQDLWDQIDGMISTPDAMLIVVQKLRAPIADGSIPRLLPIELYAKLVQIVLNWMAAGNVIFVQDFLEGLHSLSLHKSYGSFNSSLENLAHIMAIYLRHTKLTQVKYISNLEFRERLLRFRAPLYGDCERGLLCICWFIPWLIYIMFGVCSLPF